MKKHALEQCAHYIVNGGKHQAECLPNGGRFAASSRANSLPLDKIEIEAPS